MEELSIKIRIADREYPMKVRKDEEERVRAAGKWINEKLKLYREQYGLEDHQDLLAMVAFDSTVQKIQHEESRQGVDQSVSEKINHLNNLVAQALS
ncbi:MAG: cell division protein ZapA [Bacteroidetes bacterium]|nr:cell division protein ZapA [Bacteroidota bacterium]